MAATKPTCGKWPRSKVTLFRSQQSSDCRWRPADEVVDEGKVTRSAVPSAADGELDRVYRANAEREPRTTSNGPKHPLPLGSAIDIGHMYVCYYRASRSMRLVSTSFLDDLKTVTWTTTAPCKSAHEARRADHCQAPTPLHQAQSIRFETSVMPVAVPCLSVSRPPLFPPPK